MDYSIILLAAVGIFTASLFSTVSGFGFALVAMPFLTQIMPVKTAIIFIILMNDIFFNLVSRGSCCRLLKDRT